MRVRGLVAVELAGSTHEERVEALSWAIRQVPLEEKIRRRALIDLAIIEAAFPQGPPPPIPRLPEGAEVVAIEDYRK